MKPTGRADVRRRRAGLTVTEMIIGTAMASLMMLLLATTWTTFGRPALQVEARARIQQEGILAAQSLACDFGGFLADSPGRTGKVAPGGSSPYQPSTRPPWDASHLPDELWLNFYGATMSSSDQVIIRYWLDPTSNRLLRENLSTQVQTTVAQYVTAFSVVADTNYSNQVHITITITYPVANPRFTSTFTLIGVAPS
jgi:hypothetical protein